MGEEKDKLIKWLRSVNHQTMEALTRAEHALNAEEFEHAKTKAECNEYARALSGIFPLEQPSFNPVRYVGLAVPQRTVNRARARIYNEAQEIEDELMGVK